MHLFGRLNGKRTKNSKIDELTARFPEIRKVHGNNSCLEYTFGHSGVHITLRIYIPDEFPERKPVMQVIGPISTYHPWIDEYRRLKPEGGCPRLHHWYSGDKNLRLLVEEVIDMIKRVPLLTDSQRNEQSSATPTAAVNPTASSITNPNGGIHGTQTATVIGTGIMGNNSNNSNNNDITNQPSYAEQPVPISNLTYATNCDEEAVALATAMEQSIQMRNNNHVSNNFNNGGNINNQSDSDNTGGSLSVAINSNSEETNSSSPASPMLSVMPKIPDIFPGIDKLNTMQLQRLLEDDLTLKAHMTLALMAHVPPESRPDAIKSVLQSVRNSNVECSRVNLKTMEELDAIIIDASKTQQEYRKQKLEYETRIQKLRAEYDVSPTVALHALRSRTNVIDSNSEKLSAKFVHGDVEITEFLKSYLKLR